MAGRLFSTSSNKGVLRPPPFAAPSGSGSTGGPPDRQKSDPIVQSRGGVVDLVQQGEVDDLESHTTAAARIGGRNPFERILASSKENHQGAAKRLRPASSNEAVETETKPADQSRGFEQRFTIDLVKYALLSSSKSTGAPSNASDSSSVPKFSNDSLKATGELLHLFAIGKHHDVPLLDDNVSTNVAS